MADRDPNVIALTDLIGQLSDENLPAIDFDRLRLSLQQFVACREALSEAERDLQLLRQDYTGRIAGMMKAVAVTARRREAMSEVSEYLEALPQLSAELLVVEYRRASARFREAFPTSFGLPPSAGAAVTSEQSGTRKQAQTRTI